MTEEMPRFDGLYVKHGKDYSNYIRFSPGDRVSGVSTTGASYDVFKWLTPDDPKFSQGTYAAGNGNVSFSTISPSGEVVYQGQVKRNATELHLNIHSKINGRRSEAFYVFMPVNGSGGSRSSRGRFAVMGKVAGQLNIGPHVRRIDDDYWPVINFSMSDGRETVSVDFPIEVAQAVAGEMERIIEEYGGGSEIPRNWEMPM